MRLHIEYMSYVPNYLKGGYAVAGDYIEGSITGILGGIRAVGLWLIW